jgi:hypothetical protein
MSTLLPYGLAGNLEPEGEGADSSVAIATNRGSVKVDQLAEAEVLMAALRAQADPADLPMYEAGYALALDREGIISAR